MSTPSITPAMWIAVAGAVINSLLEFGLHLSAGQQHAILADVGLLAVLLGADAHIRNGRARRPVRPTAVTQSFQSAPSASAAGTYVMHAMNTTPPPTPPTPPAAPTDEPSA